VNTTTLRIEILIIGFQATIWFVILLGVPTESLLEELMKLKDVSILASIVLLGWCYSLGSVIDGFTGAIEDPRSLFKKTKEKELIQSILWLKFSDASKELTQSYYDLRLLRSTCFNLVIFSLVSTLIGLPVICSTITFVVSIIVGLSWFRRKKRVKSRKDRLCQMAAQLENIEISERPATNIAADPAQH